MKFLKFLIILVFIFNTAYSNENRSELINKISKNIRCLICQGQSVYDSNSDFALSMKLVIGKKIDQGDSEKEIYEFLEKKYGEWITYDPAFNKKTFILWTLPILLFLIGGAIIFRKVNVQK